ncbi:helix-turn-helix transcriptional regulator [Luteimonas sp. R10]|uniref:helix-turn-helix transcriptional regulator n=1 Tax=Luteimonas sp. R10 TaxID=3108176 RepID=UPI003091304F|nr:helix-turn-helix transcriptional regulator [Luteimonas sp. R10]
MISPRQHRALCRARRRLQDTDPRAGTVADIAAEAGLSQYQFIRRFAAVFGRRRTSCGSGTGWSGPGRCCCSAGDG